MFRVIGIGLALIDVIAVFDQSRLNQRVIHVHPETVKQPTALLNKPTLPVNR